MPKNIFEKLKDLFTTQNTKLTSIATKLESLEIGRGGGVGQVDATPGATYHGEIFNQYTGLDINKATGIDSHAEGDRCTASGAASHAEGYECIASDNYSHAEGYKTKSKYTAHAEGDITEAIGQGSHAEGKKNWAFSLNSHAEGHNNVVGPVDNDHMSEFEDINNCYTGLTGVGENSQYGHVEGNLCRAWGNYSHAEGYRNIVFGQGSHVEGQNNIIGPDPNPDVVKKCSSATYPYKRNGTTIYSHAEGSDNHVVGAGSHVEGVYNHVHGDYSHAGGYRNVTYGNFSYIDGESNTITVNHTSVEHSDPSHVTYGNYSHVEGRNNTLKGCEWSHLEGNGHTAYGEAVHVEGKHNTVGTEGEWIEEQTRPDQTVIPAHWGDDSGSFSHVEGKDNVTTSDAIHCEGIGNTVKGVLAHCEGQNNLVGNPMPGWLGGRYSHCEGTDNTCSNDWCHVEGSHNQTTADYQHISGKYNAPDYNAMMMIGNGRIVSEIIVPTWTTNTYYTRSGSSPNYTYTLQTSKPGDWDTYFYRYYMLDDGEYVAVPIETTDTEKRMNIFAIDDLGNLNCGQSDEEGNFTRPIVPTWTTNTYYQRVGNDYTLTTSEPANWSTTFMYYYIKDGNVYKPVPYETEGIAYGLVNGVDLEQLAKDVAAIKAHLGI